MIALVAGLIRNQFVYRLVAVFAWTIAALNILGLRQPVRAALDSFAVVIGGLRVSPLLVIKTSVLLLFTLWAANAASDFLDRRVRASADLTPSIQVLIGKLIRLLLITFAILIALSTVGIDFSALAFFSGAVGVGLGFGLQKIVSNLVSGIILLADKSIKPGDVITVGDSFGWVESMGARYTSIVTRDGREFLIPNEDFVTQRVINWSYSNDEVRLDVRVRRLLCERPAQGVRAGGGGGHARCRACCQRRRRSAISRRSATPRSISLCAFGSAIRSTASPMCAAWCCWRCGTPSSARGSKSPSRVRDVQLTQARGRSRR